MNLIRHFSINLRFEPDFLRMGLCAAGIVLVWCISVRLGVFTSATAIVARVRSFRWDRHQFCQHFLITGSTGSGKTLGGLLLLLFQVFKHQPRFGGLCVDVKGVLHEKVIAMARSFGRSDDVLVLQVRPVADGTSATPLQRFNLVGDRSVPCATYARCVVDTATALGNRQEQTFFRRATQIHIGKGLEALQALSYEVTLENVHNVLVNSEDTARIIKELNEKDSSRRLAEHFQQYLAQPPEQLAGIVGTVRNYLHYFTETAIAEVFCRDSTFSLRDVDQGKIICLSLPQKYQTERRFVGTFLKLLFYTHVFSRFDASPEERARHNLLLLLADEWHQFSSVSEDGMSDHSVLDLAREAGLGVVAATQSTTSFVPVLGADQAKVLTLNLRNRLIFTSADEDDAETRRKSCIRGDSVIVSSPQRKQSVITKKQAGCFDVSESRDLLIAAGERLLLQASRKAAKLFNGQIVTVKELKSDGSLLLTDGRILPAAFKAFTHGYCVTSHASQGRTVDHVFVAMEAQSFQAANRNQFYVSVSRGCEQVRIFTNDVEFLRMVVNKPGARMSAIELLESARRGEKEAIQQRPALKMAAGV